MDGSRHPAAPDDNPLVSIIVPVLNMRATVSRTIRSILRQNYGNLQIIVVDGASRDGTVQELARFGDLLDAVVSEPDAGPYHALNKGLALARGSLVGILNADDYYVDADVIGRYVTLFAQTPADVAFADVEWFAAGNIARTVRRYSTRRFRLADMQLGFMPPHPSIFVRRSVYELVGGFATEYQLAADFDFALRALWQHRLTFARIDAVVVRMQHGGRSTRSLGTSIALNREVIRCCRRAGLRTNWSHIGLKLARKAGGLSPLLRRERARQRLGTPVDWMDTVTES